MTKEEFVNFLKLPERQRMSILLKQSQNLTYQQREILRLKNEIWTKRYAANPDLAIAEMLQSREGLCIEQ